MAESVAKLVFGMGRKTRLVRVFTSTAILGYFPPLPAEAIPSICRFMTA